ncbi:hypothetical protein [Burkholderia sp. BCC0405]|uniref:hypothetical protein n=1 Tax=Burkholderia sp. BCC0405 TaxID=2676298 RepID=UPI00158D30E1|nr:hypothetical protein [Burkholderia sp. BCC0405]
MKAFRVESHRRRLGRSRCGQQRKNSENSLLANSAALLPDGFQDLFAGEGVTEPNDLMAVFHEVISAVLAAYMNPTEQGLCMAMYDKGMAAGFSGGIQLNVRRRCELVKSADAPMRLDGVLDLMLNFGRTHGEWIRQIRV